jgi:succinate dehydrogenase / fumarate reductase cytochrome b subunit
MSSKANQSFARINKRVPVGLSFLWSSIGKKYLMGLTGLVWAGFVLAHMLGNLLIFAGPDAYNAYGHALTSGYFIYVAEAVLVSALLIHIICAISLTVENRKARGGFNYAISSKTEKSASLASRTMIFHGTIVLIFVVLHLQTFKFGLHYETTVGGVVMRDLYRLIVETFSQPSYIGWYTVCLVLLGMHLKHGVASIFQSLGALNEKWIYQSKKLSLIYSVIVSAGFIAQPLYVFLVINK